MIAQRNRNKDEYGKGSKIDIWYLEGCVFETLTPIEQLMLGGMYNQTGEAKNERTFVKGKNTNGITEMFVQHQDKVGIKKKVTRTHWMAALDTLTEKGWIYITRTEEVPKTYGNKTTIKQCPHYLFTDYALSQIHKAKKQRDSSKDTNPLF